MLRFQILLSLTLAAAGAAQDSTQVVPPPASFAAPQTAPSPRLGLGVSLGPATVLLSGPDGGYPSEQLTSGFYLSILGPSYKLEPEFAVNRFKAEGDEAEYSFEQTITTLRFGVGLFALSSRGSTSLYYGARTGVILESNSVDVDADLFEGLHQKNKRTNFYIGPAVGAEYFVADNFSVGAEGQLIFTFYGDYSVAGSEEEESQGEVKYTAIENRALAFVRWYY